MRRRLAAALITRYSDLATGKPTFDLSAALEILDSSSLEVWGRLKRLGEGDTMLASKVVKGNAEDRRDATYVRYELLVDKNARSLTKTADYELKTFYGQLQYIVRIKIPANQPSLPPSPDITVIAFGVLQQCKLTCSHSHGLDMHYYKDMGSIDVVDVTSIQCLIGRTRWKNEWVIFDRSGPLARGVAEYDDD
ncbi:hypothetical protein DFP72DRAFT_811944 [Ephemerocybe angulata]|uniref:Uncharacterized protein n=1 Tax=Ephemerocybe angulata TaxID=980116 RepID=A0A8H6HZQ9_9AGAR|nr:hypothetical protein DFP72DRAFT_811944 [Tulosesus angulatus]